MHVGDEPGAGRTVTVYGELDAAAAPRLSAALEGADDAPGDLRIDLRACGFVDSTGIAVLASCAWRLKERGGTLLIRGAQERVRRTFDLAGLTSHGSVVFEPAPG